PDNYTLSLHDALPISQLEKILLRHSSSISVKHEISPYMDYPWHYHPEYEIIYVEKSYGIRFMGNHIGPFTDGDLMLISSNLPHVDRKSTRLNSSHVKI